MGGLAAVAQGAEHEKWGGVEGRAGGEEAVQIRCGASEEVRAE